MIKRLLPFLFLFSFSKVLAQNGGPGAPWGGLNNGDAAFEINDNEAQDLQDVDITEMGMGIKKRDGYALFKTVGNSTMAVTGEYFFRDIAGLDTTIAANNGVVYKSVAGAAFTSFITTDTVGAFYDFTDSQGYLWRANSSHDQICRWDGTTLTYYPNSPKGDQIESSPDRLIISGSTSSPNTVYFSAAADFTNFTTDIQDASPFTESFGLPGQKITAIKYALGRLFVWTKNTLSFWVGTSQFDGIIQDVSTTLGTTQPNSIIYDQGILYWQANDNHFYSFDGNVITKLSRKIKGSVANFAGGNSKTLIQTSQSDFDGGTNTYTSADISPGDVVLATFTATDTTTADFTAGTTSNTSVINNRVYLSTDDTNILNNSFEIGSGSVATDWTNGVSVITPYGRTSSICNSTPMKDGSFAFALSTDLSSSVPYYLTVLDNSGVFISTVATWNSTDGTECVWSSISSNLSAYSGRFIKLKIVSGNNDQNSVISDSFLCSGESVVFWRTKDEQGSVDRQLFDLFQGGRSDIYSGTFTSQSFNTFYTSAAWLSSGATWTTNSHSITAQTQASADGSSWDAAVAWSTGSAPASAWKQYIRYVVTLSTGGTTNGTALPYVDDVTFNARSASGTFVSSAINVGANITSWNNFGADQTLNNGTIGYFMRGASTSGGLSSVAWTAVTRDSQIGIAVNPWVQVRSTFTITSATQTPTMSAFTLNWNEGNIVRSWATVDKDHRIMWAVGENGSSVDNAEYIWDIRFGQWLKYSVPFTAGTLIDNSIYFGSPSAGNVFNWPSGTNDNGGTITAFWKSKDFIGADPFSEKDFNHISFISKNQPLSSVDVNFFVNGSTTTTGTSTVSLTDSSSNAYVRNNYLFPAGTYGTFISFKIGNVLAGSPFEFYALGFDYTPRDWRVLP